MYNVRKGWPSNAAIDEVLKADTGAVISDGMIVTVTDGKIASVTYKHNETESIGGEALKALAEQTVATNGASVDAVSGATLTSNAYAKAMADALHLHRSDAPDRHRGGQRPLRRRHLRRQRCAYRQGRQVRQGLRR